LNGRHCRPQFIGRHAKAHTGWKSLRMQRLRGEDRHAHSERPKSKKGRKQENDGSQLRHGNEKR
jgi:hypothetical protein